MNEKGAEETLEGNVQINGTKPQIRIEELQRMEEQARERGNMIYGNMPFTVVILYDPLSHSYQPYYRTLEIKPEPSSSF